MTFLEHLEADGSVLAIGRRGRGNAQLLRSKAPYAQWERKELDRYIGGPLLTRWGNRYVVGGRKTISGNGPKDLQNIKLPNSIDCCHLLGSIS